MQKIKIFGIPFDFGQDHSGVRTGLQHLKNNGLISRLEKLSSVSEIGEIKYPQKIEEPRVSGIKNLKQSSIGNKIISESIESFDLESSFLLNVGGDHGIGLGTIHGILAQRPDSIVIWADAHGDVNTPETSPSGNFHGMPLAFLLHISKHPEFEWIRHKLLPKRLILIGPRDLDKGEVEIIQRYGIQYFSSEDLNRLGAKEVLDIALNKADPMGTLPIHLSFDVDIFDENDVESTGTKVADGPKLQEVFKMGNLLGETGRLRSMDLVEFNPLIGTTEQVKASTDLVLNFLETTLRSVFSPSQLKSLPKDLLMKALDKSLL